MNKVYRYVVLRLAPDFMRGETMNVGIALFPHGEEPTVLFMAGLNKLRALDATWNNKRIADWIDHVTKLVNGSTILEECVRNLSHVGYCVSGEPGMFCASSKQQVHDELNEIRSLYIDAKGIARATNKTRRQRLVSELRNHFKKMNRLGKSVDDLSQHLIVPNVPVPDHPDLKTDFVFRNGVYRITQTLDYRVSTQAAHQKISEACMKSMAAQLAKNAWGSDTVKLAVVNIPDEIADIADSHIDLLLTEGFSVFHSNQPKDLADYYLAATGISEESDALTSYRI